MAQTRIVFLVPGFFGFTSVGAVSYFHDVERALGHALARRRIDARIVRCRTQPTASIPRRADDLRRQVLKSGGLKADELYFVGHSTGGLDVRMLLTPGVRIASGASEERIAQRTRAAISVATPHHGTPLANHFLSVQGQTLLLVLSAMATSGQGRGAILAAAKAIAAIASLDDWLGRRGTPLDRVATGLLHRIRFDRRDPLWKYLGEIERDQGAVLQLTPEGIQLFDAAVSDRPGVDYACVVAGVPPPAETFRVRSLLDPEHLALRALFRLLHTLASRPHPRYPYPTPTRATQQRLDRGLGFAVTPRTSDGVVPTLEPGARSRAARRARRPPRRRRSLHAGERRYPVTGCRPAPDSRPRGSTPRGTTSPRRSGGPHGRADADFGNRRPPRSRGSRTSAPCGRDDGRASARGATERAQCGHHDVPGIDLEEAAAAPRACRCGRSRRCRA